MVRENPLLAEEGKKMAMMGNEAIARGVVEAGTYVVTGYPGTPSSEVIMTLQELGRGLDIYAEWAINEKVAFEIALGASIGGARALVTMKGPGLNIASDPILSAAYSGTEGGLIVLVADDPGPITTQTEQDSRWYAPLSKLPMISPSNPQEAKDFFVIANELSEALKLPVFLRTTTRVNHAISVVALGKRLNPKKYNKFEKDLPRFVRAGMAWNLERHKWLNSRLSMVEELSNEYKLNRSEGSGERCVLTEGISYHYVRESIRDLDIDDIKVIKLGLVFPFPKKFILEEVKDCKQVVVVEELDPFLEESLRSLLMQGERKIPIYGKNEPDSVLPREGELNKSLVMRALAKSFNVKAMKTIDDSVKFIKVPSRPPPLCPGCPHRNSYIAILTGISKAGYKRSEIPIFGDIGCYALSVNPPLSAIWTEHSMGASISMAVGLKLSGFPKPVIATIGDSTFFHSGIQPIIEAVNKRVNLLVVILDNEVIAMTGHQSTPEWSKTETGRSAKSVKIAELLKGIGVDGVVEVNPYNLDEMTGYVAEMLRKDGVNVIIAKAPCAIVAMREKAPEFTYTVLEDKCTGCLACVRATGCPALYLKDNGKVGIIEEDCFGCGLCERYCPYDAIIQVKRDENK